MKKFLDKNGLIIILSSFLLIIFIIGGLFSSYMINNREEGITLNEERYYEAVDLISLEYNFDLDTLGQRTYIATFTYEGQTYQSYVDNTFSYVEMLEGDALDLIVMSAVKHHAEQEQLLQNTTYIVSYDSNTRTLVMEANGFHGIISVEMILNTALDGVDSYIVTSSETYNSEYNSGYTGGAVPYVEEQMMDQYILGATEIDTVAGASEGTGEAMIELIALLNLFLESMEGGN